MCSRTHLKVNQFRTNHSVGETPMDATGKVALPVKSSSRSIFEVKYVENVYTKDWPYYKLFIIRHLRIKQPSQVRAIVGKIYETALHVILRRIIVLVVMH